MSEESYWDGDPAFAAAYREADRLRLARRNSELHIAGAYTAAAMGSLLPLPIAFAGKGAKGTPYPEKPFPLASDKAGDGRGNAEGSDPAEKRAFDDGKLYMEMFTVQHNLAFQKKNKKEAPE